MFRCQKCGQVPPAGTKSAKITLQTREKTYPARGQAPSARGFRGRPANPAKSDKGGTGTEIAQELVVCPSCAAEHSV